MNTLPHTNLFSILGIIRINSFKAFHHRLGKVASGALNEPIQCANVSTRQLEVVGTYSFRFIVPVTLAEVVYIVFQAHDFAISTHFAVFRKDPNSDSKYTCGTSSF